MQMATNYEIENIIKCEVGGVSPIPTIENANIILDESVNEYEKILCGSGSCDKTLEIRIDDLLKLTQAKVLKIVK